MIGAEAPTLLVNNYDEVNTISVPVAQSAAACTGVIGKVVRAAAVPALTLVHVESLVINGIHTSAEILVNEMVND